MTVSHARANAALDSYTGVIEEIALLSAAPNPTDTWAGLTRTDYTGYTDYSTTANTEFGAAATGSRQNAQEIAFPQATGAASGNITHVAIRTGAGNEYSYGALTTPRPVGVGETPKFAIGAFTHSIT